jgi:hypothetical protein
MSLSQHAGAFVIQFQKMTDMNTECFQGRAEHVASGELVHFVSRDELIAFLELVLKQACGDENRRTESRLGNSHPALQLSKEKQEAKDG